MSTGHAYIGRLRDVPPHASRIKRLIHPGTHRRVDIIESRSAYSTEPLRLSLTTAHYTFFTAHSICIGYPELTLRLHAIANGNVQQQHGVARSISQWTLLGARGFTFDWWGYNQQTCNKLLRHVRGTRTFFDPRCLSFTYMGVESVAVKAEWNWIAPMA